MAAQTYVPRSLVDQVLVGGCRLQQTFVVAGVGDVETVGTRIGCITKGFAITQDVILVAKLRFFRTKREKRVEEEVRVEVDLLPLASLAVLISDLRRFAAEVQRTDRRLPRVLQGGGDATVLLRIARRLVRGRSR